MDDDIKLEYPVLRNGKVTTPSAEKVTPAAPEIKLEYPTLSREQQMAKQSKETAGPAELLRGATFGLSDRAIAKAMELLGKGKYEENLRQIQGERDDYRAESPWKAAGVGLAGGLMTGGAISRGLAMAGAKAAPAVASYAQGVGLGPLATRLAQTAGEGALLGELTSQMEHGPGDLGKNFGKGAAMGALTGLGATAAVKGAKVIGGMGRSVAQRVALAAGAVKPETFANKQFARSLQEQNLSPEDLSAAMKYLRGDDLQLHGAMPDGGPMLDVRPPIRVADALPKGTLNVVKKAAKSSDRAATDITEAMRNRNAEQGMRLQNNITTSLSDDVNSTAAQEALKLRRATAAKPHYDQAYAVGAPNHPLVDQWITDRPVNARLFKELEKNLAENASKGLGQGRPMTAKLDMDANGNFVWKQRPTIEDLDTLKKYIDSKRTDLWNPAKSEFNKPRTLGASDADQLKNQRDDLIKIIDQLTPDGKGGSHYANARKAFADDSDLIEAHRVGQQIIRTRPEDVRKMFDKFDGQPELQDQYRAGVAAAVNDLLDKADTEGGAAIVRKLYGSKGMQNKLNYIIGNDHTRKVFDRNMSAEKRMIETQKELAPKSSGNDLLSDYEDFSAPLALVHAMSGRFGAAANQISRFGVGNIGGMAPEVGDQLAKIALMSPENFAAWQAAQRAAQNTVGAKVGRGAGALGRLMVDGVPDAVSGAAGRMSHEFNHDQDPNDDSY